MEFKRRVGVRTSFVLLILVNIATLLSAQNLDCTNDYEATMFCHFEAQNCTDYNLTLHSNDGYGDLYCTFKDCDNGQCCCSFHQMTLVVRESYTATVWKGTDSMESKIISVRDSIKPKTPTITSVNESNGNFLVYWKTNMEHSFRAYLTANVTYHKKGGTESVSESFKPTTLDELNYYEILGRHLEPSTTYVVSVRSYSVISEKYSDSSEEHEFTTPVSPVVLPIVIIISLSFAGVVIGSMYCCYVKLKTKWWDTVDKCPNPKLLTMHPSEQEVLKLVPPIISSVCIEPLVPDDSKSWSKGSLKDVSSGSPQQSGGISAGSSCFSYANTEPVDIIASVQDALGKAFASISPITTMTTNPLTELNKDIGLLSSPYKPSDVRPMTVDMGSGSSDFDNKTYSIFIPSDPHQILTDGSEVQTQADICDPAYHPNAVDTAPCVDQKAPPCPLFTLPPVVLTVMPADMSYQCNADSVEFSYAENSSLSTVSCGSNTEAACDPASGVEDGCDSFDELARGVETKLRGETEREMICDVNPCYSCVPAGSHSLSPVDDDYQPFQNLVEQPDIVFSEERSGEKKEHLNICPEESFTNMPQSFLSPVAPGFINSVQGGQCLSEVQRPFLSLMPAVQAMPLIMDSDYQRV